MKVILLFFLFIIIFILGIIFSKVKIKIQTIQNLSEKEGRKFKFEIIVYIYLFYSIRAIQFKVKNKKKNKKQLNFDKDIIRIIKDSKLRLDYLDLNINLDTSNIIITTFLTTIISTIISTILCLNYKSINYKKCKYTVEPLFQNRNLINLNLDCMIKGDFVHISNIVYKLFKKTRRNKNERTSNRRAYGNSNE